MDNLKVRQLELEIEQINKVQNEGENIDTVDGFRKLMKKQLDKIRGRDKKKATETAPKETAPAALESIKRDYGDDDTVDFYDFTYPERGLAVIINNENFHLSDKHDDRPGSGHDAAALYQTFKNLGFKVWVKKDLTSWQMAEVLKLAQDSYDHASADCFVCAILSHGDERQVERENNIRGSLIRQDLLFGIDGKSVYTSTIVGLFSDKSCAGLKGKPRLFFIQACRGTRYDDGTKILVSKETKFKDVSSKVGHDGTDEGGNLSSIDRQLTDTHISAAGAAISSEMESDTVDPPKSASGQKGGEGENTLGASEDMTDAFGMSIRIEPVCPAPLYKDSLIMYATTPGHFAWRRQSGSWFVQSLCKVLDSPETGQRSLLNVLVQVVRSVAFDYESKSPSRLYMHEKKETPVIESMLVKDVFLTKK